MWLLMRLPARGLLALVASVLGAQDYTIRTHSDLVILDVGVKDARGHDLAGLSEKDFEIFDDGKRVAPTYFEATDTPASVGLVLDNSGSMRAKRREVILAGLGFAGTSNPRNDYFVVNFNDAVTYGLGRSEAFTANVDHLRRALDWGRPEGKTRLYDAIASALDHMRQSPLEYRVLIVVSDGGDNASAISLPELMRKVSASRATIYTIGLLDEADTDLNPRVLRKLAQASGGEYFQPATTEEIVPVFQQIAQDVRNRYVIGFVPSSGSHPSRSHTLKVRLVDRGRKARVLCRSTYRVADEKESVASASSRDVL